MTTSVRFCLSCDISEWDFIDYEMNIISKRKRIVDTDVVNDVTWTSQSVLHVWSYDLSDIYWLTESETRNYVKNWCLKRR